MNSFLLRLIESHILDAAITAHRMANEVVIMVFINHNIDLKAIGFDLQFLFSLKQNNKHFLLKVFSILSIDFNIS